DLAKDESSHAHACAKEAPASEKELCAIEGGKGKPGRGFDDFRKLGTIREDVRCTVADHAHFRILRERCHHKLQFAGDPPVVAIEKRHDFPLAFRDACIEGGSLASVGFA